MFKKEVVLRWEETGNTDAEPIQCCGILEISNLASKPLAIVYDMSRTAMYEYNIVIFHDAVSEGNGEALRNFIKRHKLGKVVASKVVNNPNTSNLIRLWTWYPNHTEIHKLLSMVKIEDDY